jgi:hypothetical protein
MQAWRLFVCGLFVLLSAMSRCWRQKSNNWQAITSKSPTRLLIPSALPTLPPLKCIARAKRPFQRIDLLRWRGLQRPQRPFCILRFVMDSTSERMHTELRIARAYVKLSCIPEDSSEPSVSLASIENCEIRMFLKWEADPDSMPLFWLELLDHGTKTSVDSFQCHRIKDAAPVFENFMSRAVRLSKLGPGCTECQSPMNS